MDAVDKVRTEAVQERLTQLWERTGDAGLGRIVEGLSLSEDPTAEPLAVGSAQDHSDWVSTALMQCFKFTGDPQVFALLYELNESSFAHAIHGKLRRTISRVDERDVLQEVFLNIYRYPHRFLAEKADSFRNWGHRIVQNTLLKFLKLESRRQRTTQLHEDLGDRPDVRARTPFRSAAEAEQQRAIDRAFLIYLNLYLLHFRQLSAKEQRALILVEVDGASYRDTAADLGIRLENLKMVVFRARRKVFRAMSRTMAELQARGASRVARIPSAAVELPDPTDAPARNRRRLLDDSSSRTEPVRRTWCARCGLSPIQRISGVSSMTAFDEFDLAEDPCTQIQSDLSAMLDGELDAASVRRVMVHSDACPSCRRFLDGIRLQARSHRQLYAVLHGPVEGELEVPMAAMAGGTTTARVGVLELRRQLTANAERLARIFYELGRGFVLMGISPNFSRIVAREPVPIPDMFQRGRNLLDEIERIAGADEVPAEWVRARELFGNDWRRSPGENLRKGVQLLREALMLSPDFHDARIYLGHAYHVAGDREQAVGQFREVLERTPEIGTRSFALLNLGNLHLETGELEEAERLFLDIVESGAIQKSPQFGLIYFNLALAYGMQQRFDECRNWLQRLYSEMPHKRRMIADEFRSREDFIASLSRHPGVYESLATSFPCWFPKKEAC